MLHQPSRPAPCAAHQGPASGTAMAGTGSGVRNGRRVLFVQRRLPAYRVPFVVAARDALQAQGVAMSFAYGTPSSVEQLKRDEGQLPGALRLPTRYLVGRACWQPFDAAAADLVIVSQENSLLYNHWLCRPWRHHKLAFFGHGGDLSNPQPQALAERYKRFTTRQADWWFAYTGLSRAMVEAAGFAPERITVLNNAVDTESLRRQLDVLAPAALAEFRLQRGLTPGKTGLFVGSLYAAKGLRLLLDAGAACAARDAQFRLLVVGDGGDAGVVREAASRYPWLHWAGALHGADKAVYLAAADFMLIPGSVGLAILDGFAAGLPIVSTHMLGHGPEIDYLQPGVNGELTSADSGAYAAAVQRLLDEPQRLQRLCAQALATGRRYTVPAMAGAFAAGVVACLDAPRSRPRRWAQAA